jgi:two-component system chemotaxis sensor kinase CheA
MQPVGSVLSKFERIVRDLSRSQNKKIKFEIFGKDTELDKTLLEAIRDPLTHLIRNSVDHGVELPEVRKARGKNEEGKILIKSYHVGGQVTIEIKDDGNGIDPQKILEKAIQKGIVLNKL